MYTMIKMTTIKLTEQTKKAERTQTGARKL